MADSLRAYLPPHSPSFAAAPLVAAASSGTAAGEARAGAAAAGQPAWVMPWQTGDRAAGRAMARALRSRRTPNGGFACFDMAKAPK